MFFLRSKENDIYISIFLIISQFTFGYYEIQHSGTDSDASPSSEIHEEKSWALIENRDSGRIIFPIHFKISFTILRIQGVMVQT